MFETEVDLEKIILSGIFKHFFRFLSWNSKKSFVWGYKARRSPAYKRNNFDEIFVNNFESLTVLF